MPVGGTKERAVGDMLPHTPHADARQRMMTRPRCAHYTKTQHTATRRQGVSAARKPRQYPALFDAAFAWLTKHSIQASDLAFDWKNGEPYHYVLQ